MADEKVQIHDGATTCYLPKTDTTKPNRYQPVWGGSMPHETLPLAHALMPMRIDVMCGRNASAALHQGAGVLCHPAELTLRAVARDARLHVEAERVVDRSSTPPLHAGRSRGARLLGLAAPAAHRR